MSVFRFKRFDVDDLGCGMKICSDSVLFGAWYFKNHEDALNIADIGSGSGILSLIAADICVNARILGIEIDHAAYEASVSNFRNSPWNERLKAVECSFDKADIAEPFDCIVSNPPYFSNGERAGCSARALARHQDVLNYDSLMDFSIRALTSRGSIGFISPSGMEDNIIYSAEMKGLKIRRRCDVYSSKGRPCKRILWEFTNHDGPLIQETLAMRDSSGKYTEDYISIVENLYVKI